MAKKNNWLMWGIIILVLILVLKGCEQPGFQSVANETGTSGGGGGGGGGGDGDGVPDDGFECTTCEVVFVQNG